jgi:phosphomannomutase
LENQKCEGESMTPALSCFKAYDIRGRVPDELDQELARRIGHAYAALIKPRRVVAVGHDIRLSSPSLSQALTAGLNEAGVEVIDLGLCGTEEVYFATSHLQLDGGIMITASHNPADYNGMKLVRQGARPVSGDTGLHEIARMAAAGDFAKTGSPGRRTEGSAREAYLEHLLSYLDPGVLRSLRIVTNAGNGCAGPVLDLLAKRLPFTLLKLQHEPDGTFPSGVPNPLLPENREVTARAVREQKADLGLAWDGDFDRCFFFDEQGNFIEGYYLVGLLAESILARHPGARVIHDPRLIWNTVEVVSRAGGIPVMSKTGHAFIKERMRSEDAVYGGEMSAHHYFRDFAYGDSGMIPWLLVAEMLCRTGRPLSAMVAECTAAFPVSGEINSRVADPDAAINRIEERFAAAPGERDYTDGLSFTAEKFRFNIRKSNTEPVLRLNVETRGDRELLAKMTAELLELIRS